MLTEENAGFYAVTPYGLLIDKELTSDEKNFFSLITAYIKTGGSCEADTSHFADMLEKEENVICRWLDHLAETEYLAVSKGRIILLEKGLVF